MIWLNGFLVSLVVFGTVYYIASTAALVACLGGKPISRSPDFRPLVSILKPVRGVDRQAALNYASYLRQDYPDYEVLFGTLEASDPAIGVILDTIQGHKGASLHIGATLRGPNDKVRVLHQLAKRARGQIIIITDSDTRVEPNFVEAMVAPFEDPGVGVVTCLYKGILAATTTDALEALHMSSVFAPGVACARLLGSRFGLGAAMAISLDALRSIGGFEAIVDYLADDYQIGRRAADLHWKVEVSHYVIDEVMSGESASSVFSRELRWSRTTRACRPLGHFGLVLTFGTVYALMLAALTRSAEALGIGLFVLAIRTLTAWVGARKLGDKEFPKRACLLLLRDVISFGVWMAGYFGGEVKWRGRKLHLTKDGRMVVNANP